VPALTQADGKVPDVVVDAPRRGKVVRRNEPDSQFETPRCVKAGFIPAVP